MCSPALRSRQGVLELLELGLQGSFEALHVGAETKGSLKEQFVVLLLSQLSSPRHDSLKNIFIHWLNFRVYWHGGRKSATPDTPARRSVASWWQDGESASCYSEWDVVYRLFCLGVLFCEWLWVAGTSHRRWEGRPGVSALEETAMEMNSVFLWSVFLPHLLSDGTLLAMQKLGLWSELGGGSGTKHGSKCSFRWNETGP